MVDGPTKSETTSAADLHSFDPTETSSESAQALSRLMDETNRTRLQMPMNRDLLNPSSIDSIDSNRFNPIRFGPKVNESKTSKSEISEAKATEQNVNEPKASEKANKPNAMSTQQLEEKLTIDGDDTLGLLSPAASIGLGELGADKIPVLGHLFANNDESDEIVNSLAQSILTDAQGEKALNEKITSANDLGAFGAGVAGVAGSLGLGWLVNKQGSSLPAAARLPLAVVTSLAGGGMINNAASGEEILSSDGFIKNALNTGAVVGSYKAFSSLAANRAISPELLAKVGLDPGKEIIGANFVKELTLHGQNLEMQAWKAATAKANSAMKDPMMAALAGGRVGGLAGIIEAVSYSQWLKHGPIIPTTFDKVVAAVPSRLSPMNYTPFKFSEGGFEGTLKYVGMGGERTAQKFLETSGKEFLPWGAVSAAEYNTRSFASKLLSVTAGAYAFGAANKTGEMVTSDANNENKSWLDYASEIGLAGFDAAKYAPLAVIASPGLSGAMLSTGLIVAAKGLNSLENFGQSVTYNQFRKRAGEKIQHDKEMEEFASNSAFLQMFKDK